MEIVVLVLVVAGLVGAVIWNRSNAAAARRGTEFHVEAAPGDVADAVGALYCQGKKAALARMVRRLTVKPTGLLSFGVESPIGDQGVIEISAAPGGSVVRTHATTLFVGVPPRARTRSGQMGIASSIVHGLYVVLGIAPNAAKVKKFGDRVERDVRKEVVKRATV